MSKKISDEKRREIIRLKNEGMTHAFIQKKLETTGSTITKVLRECGMAPPRETKSEHEAYIQYIREHYADTDTEDVARACGRSVFAVRKMAGSLGVRKSEEYMKRVREKALRCAISARTAEVFSRMGEIRKKTVRMERFRLRNGQPQKTKLKVVKLPNYVKNAVFRLCKKRGYIRTTDPYTLFYDENTRRIDEAYYETKHHLRFMEDTGEVED